MGIIINDTITLNNGLTASTIYCSFGDDEIFIKKNNGEYYIEGHYKIWFNKDYRTDGKHFLDTGMILVKITSNDLSSNLYTLMYNELKTNYTSTTDDL